MAAAPALVWTSDATGARTYVNPAWLEFRGRRLDEELGSGWSAGVHPDDVDGYLAIYRAALTAREPFVVEYRLLRNDGEHRWMLERGAPAGSGADPGFVGVCVEAHEQHLDRERVGLLADVTAALVSEVSIDDRLRALSDLLAERLDWACAVEIIDERGDPGPGPGAAPGAPLPDDARATVSVPLVARGRTLGRFLVAARGGRDLDEDELRLAGAVALRAGFALDNALLLLDAQATAERLRLLQEATAALSSSAGPSEVGGVAMTTARALLHATAATVYEVVGDHLEVLARDGATGRGAGRWARVPLRLEAPVTDAVRERRPIVVHDRDGWRRRYPHLVAEADARGITAASALPLRAGETVVGVIALTHGRGYRAAQADDEMADALAEVCGQALARARLQREVEAERGRAERLAEVSFALDAESGVDERLSALLAALVPDIADLATVRLAAEEERPSRLAAVAAADDDAAEVARDIYGRYSAPPDHPGPERVIATGQPELIVDCTEQMAAAYAPDEPFMEGLRRLAVVSYMSLPLAARGTVLGALTLMSTPASGRRFADEDLSFAREVARRAALALDNARVYEAEQAARGAAERARRRAERIQRVTAALAAALTEEAVAQVVVEEMMEALSAAAGVVALREGDQGRVLVSAGYPTDLLRPEQRFELDGPYPLSLVLRTGEELWLERAEDWRTRFGTPRRELGAAGVCLPLLLGAEVVGAIGFRFGQDERAFDTGDRRLARTLANQCAQALERARLYEAERHTAEVLQRALLPARLPAPGRARVDVRYLPAAGGRSGGDFYDVVELDDGRMSLVVGDVVGHGVEAAAVMGQLRSAWHAFASEGMEPRELVRRLSRVAERVEGASIATVACVVVDGEELRYACAGHPPPLLRRPGRPAEYLMEGRGPPLAVDHERLDEGRTALEPGSLVVLYTDGVVEGDRDLDRGFAELAAVVDRGPPDPPSVLARLTEAIGPDPADDCALLALRVPPRPAALSLEVPADPAALRDARASMRRWLADAGVERPDAEDVVLAASEALSNSLEHASREGAPPARPVRLELTRPAPDEVSVIVRDEGRWRPPEQAPPGRGRGLPLMRSLMDSVEVEPGATGTVVRMRRRLDPRRPGATLPGDAAAAALELRAHEVPAAGLVRLDGELDAAVAPATLQRLRSLARGKERLTLDLSEVRHLDSGGARMIVELAESLRSEGRALEVVAPPGTIARRVLDLSGLAPVLAVSDGPAPAPGRGAGGLP